MKDHELSAITNEDKIKQAHHYLTEFLKKYNYAKRGGIHDFMELTLANMVTQAVANIDSYLETGHINVSANEIMAIVAESFQKVIDSVKKNLDGMKTIGLQ